MALGQHAEGTAAQRPSAGVRYMLERWNELTYAIKHSRIPLDNNAGERALRSPVVGRKNHCGSRSLWGTQVAVPFYTLCDSVRPIGVDAYTYLQHALDDVLVRPGTVTLPEYLLPDA